MNQSNFYNSITGTTNDSIFRLVPETYLLSAEDVTNIEQRLSCYLRKNCLGRFCPLERCNSFVYEWIFKYVDTISFDMLENIHHRNIAWVMIRYMNVRACPHIRFHIVADIICTYRSFYTFLKELGMEERILQLQDRSLLPYSVYKYLKSCGGDHFQSMNNIHHVSNFYVPKEIDNMIISFVLGENLMKEDCFHHLRLSQKFNLSLLKSLCDTRRLHFQSGSRQKFLDENDLLSVEMKKLHEASKKFEVDNIWIKHAETLCLCVYQIFRSRNSTDVIVAITAALNSITGKSVILSSCKILYELAVLIGENIETRSKLVFQSNSKSEQVLSALSFLDDEYDRILDSKLVKNLEKLNKYFIAFGLWNYFGLEGEFTDVPHHERIFLKKKFNFGPGFFHTIFKTIVDLSKRILILKKTGDVISFFDDTRQISTWANRAQELIDQYALISSGVSCGKQIYTARKDMIVLIEEGKKLYKWSANLGIFEKNILRNRLSELEGIHRKDLSVISAMKTRKVPYSILFHGDSGVGKSTLIDVIFQHYGKTFGIDIGDEFKYTKNPVSKYWDNFKSHQWCIVLDDVAFMKPDKAQGIDPTLEELLQIVNNVPYVVDQASLSDKGTTPLQAQLCIATTNTMNLNVHSYFAHPVAVSRRLPYIVTVTVKKEFATNGMLDSQKANLDIEGHYMNYWNFEIRKVKVDLADRRRPTFEKIAEFDDINYFLQWFSKSCIDHDKNQEKVMQNKIDTSRVEICRTCYLNKVMCECENILKPQSKSVYDDDYGLEDEVAPGITVAQYTESFEQLQQLVAEKEDTIKKLESDLTSVNMCNESIAFFEKCGVALLVFLLNIFYFIGYCGSCIFGYHMPKHNVYTFHNCSIYIPQFVVHTMMKISLAQIENKLFKSNNKEWYFFTVTQKKILQVVGILSLATISYSFMKKIFMPKKKKQIFVPAQPSVVVNNVYPRPIPQEQNEETSGEEEDEDENEIKVQPQGISSSVGEKPIPDTDSKPDTVWKNDNFEVCALDLNRASTSSKGMPFEQFKNKILENCYTLVMSDDVSSEEVLVRAVVLTSNIFVTNYHSFDTLADKINVRIVGHTDNLGINDGCDLVVLKKEMLCKPERDLVFLKLSGFPMRKSVIKYLPYRTFDGVVKGQLIGREEHGAIFSRTLKNVRKNVVEIWYKSGIQTMTVWSSTPNVDTEEGDCGSAMILDCPIGYVFAGIHCAGSDKKACSAPIYYEDMKEVFKFFDDEDWSMNLHNINGKDTNHELVRLHPKSPFRFIQQNGSARVFGSFKGSLLRSKSRVGPTAMRNEVLARGYNVRYGSPVLTGWQPKRIALLDMTSIKKNIPKSIVEKCADAFYNDIIQTLPEEALEQLQVLDNDTVINGAAGVRFLDRIKLNTSTGMPWNKKKRSMIASCSFEDNEMKVEFDPEIMERVDEIIENYKDNKLNMPVFKAHLKDEPVSEKKQKSGKTRVFCGAPIDFTIVVRKYYLGCIRCMQNNPFVFEAAPGVNHNSKQWQDIAGYLSYFGCDQIVAGDYAAYDKNMCGYVIYTAFKILIRLTEKQLLKKGVSDEKVKEVLKIMKGIANDTAYPTVDFFGDLVQFFGSNPSGHPLTVTINGIVNSIYMRYAYYMLHPDHDLTNFKKHVHLLTYGDDNIMGVSKEAPWFNHTAIARVLAHAGITYTMAEKEAESVPYINISEASFLKRSFRYDEDLDIIQAPLDHSSIEKTLTTCVLSKSVCLEKQSVDAMTSCLCEYFQYGKKIFTRARREFIKILEEADLISWVEDSSLPIYEDLVKRYHDASENYEFAWPLATGHERMFNPKLLSDSDPCFLRMDDFPERDT